MSGGQGGTGTRTPRRRAKRAPEEEGRWLNVKSQAVAIVGEERWVGECDSDFPLC